MDKERIRYLELKERVDNAVIKTDPIIPPPGQLIIDLWEMVDDLSDELKKIKQVNTLSEKMMTFNHRSLISTLSALKMVPDKH